MNLEKRIKLAAEKYSQGLSYRGTTGTITKKIEDSYDGFKAGANFLLSEVQPLIEALKPLIEALEWYSDKSNGQYRLTLEDKEPITPNVLGQYYEFAVGDFVSKAIEALAKFRGEE